MRIIAVGGGSGGHVTPVVAVLRELKEKQPEAQVRFWCDRKFAPQARSIMGHFDPDIDVTTISAGKLRRYNALPLWRQLIRPSIVLPNIRDAFLVGVGFIESLVRLIAWRPDVIFTKGGFVCLPVGMAARILRIPLVIHDSDAHPGLTNRMLAGGAALIATGAPLHFYSYPKDKTRYVGIPISDEFKPMTDEQRSESKEKLGFDSSRPLVVITGGGLGAQRLNDTVVDSLDGLLSLTSVMLVSGVGQYDELLSRTPSDDPRFRLEAFISEGMAGVLGAADIVVARAGATTIMELAALAKPTILVPNAYLTGGHQLKNAAVYTENGAVKAVEETAIENDPNVLLNEIKKLLLDSSSMQKMQELFYRYAKPRAAEEVADMIIEVGDKHGR